MNNSLTSRECLDDGRAPTADSSDGRHDEAVLFGIARVAADSTTAGSERLSARGSSDKSRPTNASTPCGSVPSQKESMQDSEEATVLNPSFCDVHVESERSARRKKLRCGAAGGSQTSVIGGPCRDGLPLSRKQRGGQRGCGCSDDAAAGKAQARLKHLGRNDASPHCASERQIERSGRPGDDAAVEDSATYRSPHAGRLWALDTGMVPLSNFPVGSSNDEKSNSRKAVGAVGEQTSVRRDRWHQDIVSMFGSSIWVCDTQCIPDETILFLHDKLRP